MLKRDFTVGGALGEQGEYKNIVISPYTENEDKRINKEYAVLHKEKYGALNRILEDIEKGLISQRIKLKNAQYDGSDVHSLWIDNLDKRLMYQDLLRFLDSYRQDFNQWIDESRFLSADSIKKKFIEQIEYLDKLEGLVYRTTDFAWYEPDEEIITNLFNLLDLDTR